MNDKERLLSEMDRCVVEMEDEEIVNVAKEYVDAGYDAYEGITEGLSKGMEKAGELYEEEEYFVPELLICSDANSFFPICNFDGFFDPGNEIYHRIFYWC